MIILQLSDILSNLARLGATQVVFIPFHIGHKFLKTSKQTLPTHS